MRKCRLSRQAQCLKKLIEKAEVINNVRFISGTVDAASPDMLKNLAYQVKNSYDNAVLVIGSETDGKANLAVFVSDKLVSERNISAVAIIKEIASEIKGGGGGQPFLATAGGKNPAGINDAIRKAAEYIRKI